MLAGQQNVVAPGNLDERAITGIPGRTLKTGAGLHLHTDNPQRYAQRRAQRPTTVRPGFSHSLKTMMNMNGT